MKCLSHLDGIACHTIASQFVQFSHGGNACEVGKFAVFTECLQHLFLLHDASEFTVGTWQLQEDSVVVFHYIEYIEKFGGWNKWTIEIIHGVSQFVVVAIESANTFHEFRLLFHSSFAEQLRYFGCWCFDAMEAVVFGKDFLDACLQSLHDFERNRVFFIGFRESQSEKITFRHGGFNHEPNTRQKVLHCLVEHEGEAAHIDFSANFGGVVEIFHLFRTKNTERKSLNLIIDNCTHRFIC